MITKLTTMYKFRWLEPKHKLQTSKACNSCVLGNVAHSLLGGRYPRINPTPPPPSAREGGGKRMYANTLFIDFHIISEPSLFGTITLQHNGVHRAAPRQVSGVL